MQSSVYPNIVFLKNDNLTFLGTSIAQQQQLKILHPSNPLNAHYTMLISKLFNQIKIIKEMLWIGKIPSTQIVRIYFSEPLQYPAAYCCRRPVVVQVQNDRSGTIVCSKCEKEVMKFVKAGKGSDEEMFKVVQRQTKARKQQLKSLLTSLKFRGKKLRNNFLNDSKNIESDLIVQITDTPSINIADPKTDSELSASLAELKAIVNDIFA